MAGPIPFRRSGLLAQHSERNERIDSMRVKMSYHHGRVLIVGAGEATVEIPFPVVFTERPLFTFGGELDTNHRPSALAYPTVSGVVVDWDERGGRLSADGRFYGATVAVVTTGLADQQMWFHYRFEGMAIRNPLHDVDSADDTV